MSSQPTNEPTSTRTSEWLAIVGSANLDVFAGAFTTDPILEASILPNAIAGVDEIFFFFSETKDMYDVISFVHEASSGPTTYLEWEGLFCDREIAGITTLHRNPKSLIEAIHVYYRPKGALEDFSIELIKRMRTRQSEGT